MAGSTTPGRGSVRTTIAVVAGAILLLGTTGPVLAEHLPPVTARCTYEFGEYEPNFPFSLDYAMEDPTGLTADGAINDTACLFHTPDSDPGENCNPDACAVHFLLSGAIRIDGQYGQGQASVVDDIFGSAIGGIIAADFNHDHLVGDASEGEPEHHFCGTSPVVDVGHDSDGDGHADLGWGLVVLVHGYIGQALNCDPVAGPASTTGGVLDPAGGIFMTVSG